MTYALELRSIGETASRHQIIPFVSPFLRELVNHYRLSEMPYSVRTVHLLSVEMNPGEMQFTLAKSVHSTARDFARCTTAAFEAL